ncbi:tRNA lysidine(34) synthetase TilS [Spirochaeta dissipatitropha]
MVDRNFILDQIRTWWDSNSFADCRHVILALSGGRDSMLLLHILSDLKVCKVLDSVTAAWFDHSLRPVDEISREKAVVTAQCNELGIPLRTGNVLKSEITELRKSLGMEAAARLLRHQFLEDTSLSIASGKTTPVLLAFAHHRNDQVETLLLRLASGTGLSALSAIPSIRELNPSVKIIRPLLCLKEEDLRVAYSVYPLQFHTDSSNHDTDISRNAVRNLIVPNLYTQFPDLPDRVQSISKDFGELLDWQDRTIAEHSEMHSVLNGLIIRCKTVGVLSLPPVLRFRLFCTIQNALSQGEHGNTGIPARISRKSIAAFENLDSIFINSRESKWTKLLNAGGIAVWINVESIDFASERISLQHIRCRLSAAELLFSVTLADNLKDSFSLNESACIYLRSVQPGDRIGSSESAKQWFQRNKIPQHLRPAYFIAEHIHKGIYAIISPAAKVVWKQKPAGR